MARPQEALEQMQKQAFFVVRKPKENGKKGFEYKNIIPIPSVSWNDYDDNVKIRFDIDIMPYLINLKSNFTKYAILDVMDFKSKYSVPIYKLLNMTYNQYEHYAETKLRTKKQLDKYQNPIFPLDELRHVTDTEEGYSDFRNFEKRVLRTAVDEINEHTHFNISYEKIKEGRSIGYIQFFITKKQVAKNEFYKEEKQDKPYVEQQQQDEADFLLAMRHPYTAKLVEYKLLEFNQVVNDKKTMLILYRAVYDKYSELELDRKLDQHLSYVKAHMEPYSRPNIAEYLRVSVEQYIADLK